MKRIFIAIKIYPDSGFREFITKVQLKLGKEKIRWVDSRNLHLTLRFLGEMDEDLVPYVSEELSKVALDTMCFSLILKGTGVFRSVSYPRVIWAGVEKNEVLKDIKKKIDKGLEVIGIEKENRSFSPHLTIGRMKRINDRDNLRDLIQENAAKPLLVQDVESMVLFESILREQGPEYIPLKEFFFL